MRQMLRSMTSAIRRPDRHVEGSAAEHVAESSVLESEMGKRGGVTETDSAATPGRAQAHSAAMLAKLGTPPVCTITLAACAGVTVACAA